MTVKVDAMWTVGGDMALDVVGAPVKGGDVELGVEVEVEAVVARREEEVEGHRTALGVVVAVSVELVIVVCCLCLMEFLIWTMGNHEWDAAVLMHFRTR